MALHGDLALRGTRELEARDGVLLEGLFDHVLHEGLHAGIEDVLLDDHVSHELIGGDLALRANLALRGAWRSRRVR